MSEGQFSFDFEGGESLRLIDELLRILLDLDEAIECYACNFLGETKSILSDLANRKITRARFPRYVADPLCEELQVVHSRLMLTKTSGVDPRDAFFLIKQLRKRLANEIALRMGTRFPYSDPPFSPLPKRQDTGAVGQDVHGNDAAGSNEFDESLRILNELVRILHDLNYIVECYAEDDKGEASYTCHCMVDREITDERFPPHIAAALREHLQRSNSLSNICRLRKPLANEIAQRMHTRLPYSVEGNPPFTAI